MAKKRRRRRQEEAPQVENRRETRLRARERERNLRLTLIIGGIVGVALILVLYSVVNELIIKPNSVLAQVEDKTIITRDFWQQSRLRQSDLENQRVRLQVFAQQFGDSGLFASQIASINATLASPLTLGTQVLNDMIEGAVLQIKAPEVGVSVTDEEVDETLREEVARGQGALTDPQATATADAAIEATATAESFTPTPAQSPEVDAVGPPSESSPDDPSAPEQVTVLNDALYQEGLGTLEENLRENAGMSLANYREVIRARLLRTKMSETISQDLVSTTGEQARVRHILITVDPEPEGEPPPAETPAAETTADVVADDDEDDSPPAPEEWNPDTNGDGRVDDAEALAFAQTLHQRILDGEDFADLALRFSNDPGSGSQGGDLGWAARGRYVPEFDEAAFTLEVGEISAPVKTSFGYHIIEVLERDDERPKEEAALQQEYAEAFQTWLQEQVLSLNIDRPNNLSSMLPRNLGQSADQ